MTNIAELLKCCPEGTKLYSPLLGEVEFAEVMDTCYMPIRVMCGSIGERFDEFGRYKGNEYPDSECLLFPSKDCRTWEGWKPSKPHYDISNFKPFDKVLTRDTENGKWNVNLFSYYIDDEDARITARFRCMNSVWHQCIPYEGNEHLLGTTKPCSEEYINW